MGERWQTPGGSDPDEPEYQGDPADLFELPSLDELLHRPTWHREAACRGMGPATMFLPRGADTEPAKDICRGCPVTTECLAAGLREHAGIWAGLSERQRRAARREAA